jgi:hypothetical protein
MESHVLCSNLMPSLLSRRHYGSQRKCIGSIHLDTSLCKCWNALASTPTLSPWLPTLTAQTRNVVPGACELWVRQSAIWIQSPAAGDSVQSELRIHMHFAYVRRVHPAAWYPHLWVLSTYALFWIRYLATCEQPWATSCTYEPHSKARDIYPPLCKWEAPIESSVIWAQVRSQLPFCITARGDVFPLGERKFTKTKIFKNCIKHAPHQNRTYGEVPWLEQLIICYLTSITDWSCKWSPHFAKQPWLYYGIIHSFPEEEELAPSRQLIATDWRGEMPPVDSSSEGQTINPRFCTWLKPEQRDNSFTGWDFRVSRQASAGFTVLQGSCLHG